MFQHIAPRSRRFAPLHGPVVVQEDVLRERFSLLAHRSAKRVGGLLVLGSFIDFRNSLFVTKDNDKLLNPNTTYSSVLPLTRDSGKYLTDHPTRNFATLGPL